MDKTGVVLWQYCFKIPGKLEQAQKSSSACFQRVFVLGPSDSRSSWPLLVSFTCFKTRKSQLSPDQSQHTAVETMINCNPGFCLTSSFTLLKELPWFALCKIMTHWSVSPETNPTSARSSFSKWWSCKIGFTGRLWLPHTHRCKMVSPASMCAGDHVQHVVWLRRLIDPRLVPADRRGPAGLETSLGSRECSYNPTPVADVNVIGFEQILLLFLCGRETSSETRMKFQPYLRECMWDSGTQQEKRANAFSGFLLLSSCAEDSLPYLNFKVFKTLLGF